MIVIGASGAIYGLLLAYALYFPERPIYMYFRLPDSGEVLRAHHGCVGVLLVDGQTGGVAHATHLGGLVVGYFFLKGVRLHPFAELKYRYLKWKITRGAQAVRCLPGRTAGRLESSRALEPPVVLRLKTADLHRRYRATLDESG